MPLNTIEACTAMCKTIATLLIETNLTYCYKVTHSRVRSIKNTNRAHGHFALQIYSRLYMYTID